MLIPWAWSQSPSKIALDCSLLAKTTASTILIQTPEPLLAGQHALSHWLTNTISPK